MTIRLNPRWLLASTLLLSFQLAHAVVVPPTLSFDLGATNATATQLWDLTGSYNLSLIVDQRNAISEPVQISLNLIQDAKGKLTNPIDDVQSMAVGDNSDLTVFPKITGKVTGSGGVARVHFTVRFTGEGRLAGQDVSSLKGSFTVDAETVPSTGRLVGVKQSKFNASFSGSGSLKGTSDFGMDLPPGVNGSWNLSLQLAAFSKVTGTGIIRTPSHALGLDLSGSFKNDIFKIKAKGVSDVPDAQDGTGSSATIQLTTSFDSLVLNGKVLGQKLSFDFPPADQN